MAILIKNPIFAKINGDILKATDLTHVFLSKGETLFQEGAPSYALYLIIKGQLKAIFTHKDASQVVLNEISAGDIVGEIEIIVGGKRSMSVVALSDTQLVKLPKAAFENLVEKFPEVLPKMAHIIEQRLRHRQLVTILPNLFGPNVTYQEIESRIEWLHLRGGDPLFRQGDIGDSLYIVVSGRLQVVVEHKDGKEQVIDEISQGESINEGGVIFPGEKRMVSIYALRNCELAKFSQLTFERVIKQHPDLMMTIAQNILRRQRMRNHTLPRSINNNAANIAVVPVSPDAPLTDFSHRLLSALSAFDSTLYLSSARVDNFMEMTGAAQWSPKEPQSIRLVTWLDEQESKHRFILYQADMTITAWTKWCLRRADKIILVAEAAAIATRDEMRTALLNAECLTTNVSRILVLLHPDGSQQPSGTQQWLSAWQPKIHHHIRWNQEADFGRLARFMSGQAVGLVFSGGGARGFVHFGVYLALKEAGIPVDMIGGTSIGGHIGAQCAAEWDRETMLRVNRKGLIEMNPYKAYQLPFVSLLKGMKMKESSVMAFGDDTQIEDLWINFFCISSNLSTHQMNIHRQGNLEKAIRATTAIPGIAEPILEKGHLLIDGGILNNLPSDIMQQFCRTVIVVDIAEQINLTVEYDRIPSSWEILWSRICPFKKSLQFPSILDILLGATLLSSNGRAKIVKADADFYLKPPVEQFKRLEFTALEELVEVGYQYTKNEIENWQNSGTEKWKELEFWIPKKSR